MVTEAGEEKDRGGFRKQSDYVRRMACMQIMLKRNASSATAERLFHFGTIFYSN